MPRNKTKEKEERASMTGRTPTPEELGEGTKLEWPYKGTVHKAVIIKQGDQFLVRVGKTISRSLSQAAQAISGHAQRGGICWRRKGETQPLLGRINYAALAGATPAPAKPRAKKPAAKKRSTKATSTHGKVKSKWECGNCHQKFPTQAKLTAHVGREHKEAK